MRVSIVTIVYNNRHTISDALDSVLSQTDVDLEYIVIDGASTDGTLDILRSYEDRISVLVSEPDKGIYDAMNKGLALVTGDIVGILNSDDLYAGISVLSDVLRCFADTGSEAVYGDLEYVSAGDTGKVVRKWRSGKYKEGAFLYGWMPPHPAFFVRKELYERWGRFNLALKSAADYELMLRLIHKHRIKVGYIPKLLVKMRVGGVSNANIGSRFKANREDRLAWKLNDIRPYFFTAWLKPLRKITQYLSWFRP